jgi:hypothetical protein
MLITLELSPELEQALKAAAEQAGLEPRVYIMQALRDRLPRGDIGTLSKRESELLLRINQSLSYDQWQKYYHLRHKRQEEQLTQDEHHELIALSDELEESNAQRMTYMAELAQLRNISLDKLMKELGLIPASHA